MSQYDSAIKKDYQASACGPVTAFTLIRQHTGNKTALTVNDLYKKLGCTKIGLSKFRFIHNLRKVLGSDWMIDSCGIEELKNEILEGRPVAAKFDKWTSLRWFSQFEFDYHWVSVVGFEEVDGELWLFVHDNGSPDFKSRIRRVSYLKNKVILSFVMVKNIKK